MNDFDKICRICLETHNTLFSLFGRRKGCSPYDKLTKINIKVHISDSERSFICLQCLSDLDTAVNFFERCEKANEILSINVVQTLHKNEIVKETISELENASKSNILLSENVFEPEEIKAKQLKVDHLEEKSCPDCGSKSYCKHWKPIKTHTCQYCQKVFNRKFNFKIHL